MKTQMIDNLNFTAEHYAKKFKPHMDVFENSIVGKHVGRSASHTTALGKMLENWNQYKAMKEANGSISSLGQVPGVAAGVITASFSSNALNVIANVQALPEQNGIVYYEETKASSTHGNVTAGKVLLSPNAAPEVYPVGYSSSEVSTQVIGATVDNQLAYTFPAAASFAPVVPRTVTVAIALTAGTITAIDDGAGNLIGKAMGGSIDYATGNIVLNLYADPNEVKDISIGYGIDGEAKKGEVEVELDLKTFNVNSRTYILRAQLGIFKQFALEQRFGIDGKERLAVRLTQELNNELTNEGIAKLVIAAQGTETWNKKPATNVSWVEHKLEFLDVIARAENNMLQNAGRGKVTCIVAAPNVATIIKNLPGFIASDDVGPGATVYGTLEGVTIVRAPQLAPTTNAATANSAFALYRGEEPFDGAAIYAPYMPIVSIEDVPVENTIAMKRNGVAHMAAVEVPSKNFVTRIDVTNV